MHMCYVVCMQRLKDPATLAKEIREHLARQGLTTGSAIARATGLGQPQVHRNLFGRPKRVTRTLVELCKYASIDASAEASDPRDSPILMNALSQVWDGTEGHARRLARLLFAHHQAHT